MTKSPSNLAFGDLANRLAHRDSNPTVLALIALVVLALGAMSCKKEEVARPAEEQKLPPTQVNSARDPTDVDRLSEADMETGRTSENSGESSVRTDSVDLPRSTSVPSKEVRKSAKSIEAEATKATDRSPLDDDNRTASPTRVAENARALRRRARQESNSGDWESAYEHTLAAWVSVRMHAEDPRCQELAAELLSELEAYGNRMSARNEVLVPDGRLSKPAKYE